MISKSKNNFLQCCLWRAQTIKQKKILVHFVSSYVFLTTDSSFCFFSRMECLWQTYTKLQESLNKVNLINAQFQFVLNNGNIVEGLLGDFVFDQENLFLELKDVSISEEKFGNYILMGMHICRWRIVEFSSSNAEKPNSSQSTFSQAAFISNGSKSDGKDIHTFRYAFFILIKYKLIHFTFLQWSVQ